MAPKRKWEPKAKSTQPKKKWLSKKDWLKQKKEEEKAALLTGPMTEGEKNKTQKAKNALSPVYTNVLDQFLSSLEKKEIPWWSQPWETPMWGHPMRLVKSLDNYKHWRKNLTDHQKVLADWDDWAKTLMQLCEKQIWPHCNKDFHQSMGQLILEFADDSKISQKENGLTRQEKVRDSFIRAMLSGSAYRGNNGMLLNLAFKSCGYNHHYWLTFKQAKDMGCQIQKGAKSVAILHYEPAKCKDSECKNYQRTSFCVHTAQYHMETKKMYVFNVEQLEMFKSDHALSETLSETLAETLSETKTETNAVHETSWMEIESDEKSSQRPENPKSIEWLKQKRINSLIQQFKEMDDQWIRLIPSAETRRTTTMKFLETLFDPEFWNGHQSVPKINQLLCSSENKQDLKMKNDEKNSKKEQEKEKEPKKKKIPRVKLIVGPSHQAFYELKTRTITIPDPKLFRGQWMEYWMTMFREFVHAADHHLETERLKLKQETQLQGHVTLVSLSGGFATDMEMDSPKEPKEPKEKESHEKESDSKMNDSNEKAKEKTKEKVSGDDPIDRYSWGALVAEMGAGFLAARFGMEMKGELLTNQMGYLQGWLIKLSTTVPIWLKEEDFQKMTEAEREKMKTNEKEEKGKQLIWASTRASKAVEFVIQQWICWNE